MAHSSNLRHFSEFLLRDGTGSSNINNDDAAADGEYWRACPTLGVKLVDHILIHVTDSGNLDAGFYGNNITLTDGLLLKHVEADGTTLVHDLTPLPVKTNAQWARYTANVRDLQFGTGVDSLVVQWTFTESLVLQPLQRVVMVARDDMSGLVEHTALIQGRYSVNGFS